MLLGATMDSFRAASVLKNLRTLHIRMQEHNKNSLFLAKKFEAEVLKTVYPGLQSNPSHKLFKYMMNEAYWFGGMFTLNVGSLKKANELMKLI